MLLDPAVSCEESFANRPIEGVRYALKDGQAGPGDVVFNMGLDIVLADTPDEVDYGRVYAKRIALDYTVPRDLLASTRWLPYLDINDSHVFCITLAPPGAYRSYRVLVFRKSDKTWHVLRTPSEIGPDLRGFGRYIAVTEKNEMSRRIQECGQGEVEEGQTNNGPGISGADDNPRTPSSTPGSSTFMT